MLLVSGIQLNDSVIHVHTNIHTHTHICVCIYIFFFRCFSLVVKNLPASGGVLRDIGSIPGSAMSPGGGHGNPLQYSCLGKSQGLRSLVGYSLWGCKESNMTEVT